MHLFIPLGWQHLSSKTIALKHRKGLFDHPAQFFLPIQDYSESYVSKCLLKYPLHWCFCRYLLRHLCVQFQLCGVQEPAIGSDGTEALICCF